MAANGNALLGLLACAGMGICYGGLAGALFGSVVIAAQAPSIGDTGIGVGMGLFYGFLEGGFFGFFVGLLAGSLGGHRGWLVSGICGGWALFLWLGNGAAESRSSVRLWVALASGSAIGVGWLLSRAIKRHDERFPLVSLLVESSGYQALERSRWRRLLAGALLAGFGYLFILLPLHLGFGSRRVAARYFLPWNYTGLITIRYEIPHAPVLPTEDGTLIHSVPSGGVLDTSSALPDPSEEPEQFYYADGGRRQRLYSEYEHEKKNIPLSSVSVWGLVIDVQANAPVERFFIGTQQQYDIWQATQPHR